ncbi:MAG: uracil-DNA glycosylase family protein [Rhodospirillaceae bacterium]|nr:uracil-DNA glycosylase family protein [Rhodospirillaceae bacterium]
MVGLAALLDEIAGCRICAEHLPLGPRPVVRAEATARVLIIGQAPGTKVHESGTPWDDRSGDRLRDWLDVAPETFYDASKIAIMPMGFCYPSANPKGGDNPPRPECAPQWHDLIRAELPSIELTLLVGSYAQTHYFGKAAKRTMTETIRAWRDYGPEIIPTPHPSWRTTFWLKKNPWFDDEVVPEIRHRLQVLI